MKWRLPYFMVLPFLLLAACSQEAQVSGDPLPVTTWFPQKLGGKEIQVQVAIAPAEQVKGLMYRESLPTDSGMLFIYTRPQRMSFWMANTPLPLDIGFFNAEGVLLEIRRMYPFDTTKIRSSNEECQYALEMLAGWYKESGILPGARLDLELLAEALRSRGADPGRYGIGQ